MRRTIRTMKRANGTTQFADSMRRFRSKENRGWRPSSDFTATPRHTKGQLFSWTVYDYPLKQAIIDRIVKKPLKGITTGIKEQSSSVASTRYQAYLTAGVERWREYRDQLKPLQRKPILFVMMNNTAEADDVGDWLRRNTRRSLQATSCSLSTPTKAAMSRKRTSTPPAPWLAMPTRIKAPSIASSVS